MTAFACHVVPMADAKSVFVSVSSVYNFLLVTAHLIPSMHGLLQSCPMAGDTMHAPLNFSCTVLYCQCVVSEYNAIHPKLHSFMRSITYLKPDNPLYVHTEHTYQIPSHTGLFYSFSFQYLRLPYTILDEVGRVLWKTVVCRSVSSRLLASLVLANLPTYVSLHG